MSQASKNPFKVDHDPEIDGLLTRVIEWCQSDAPDWFDDSFVHEMYMRFEEKGTLSPGQVTALENIARKFNID